jgi:hypothetical protein
MRDHVVGHIINHGFSSFEKSELMKKADLKETKSPFNISLAAVVYKLIDPYFADYLENASADMVMSASWELGFDEYHLALGSRNLENAEIVTKDSHVKELTQFLRAKGGSGFNNEGVEVYRVVVGDVLPTGCAFTETPAAAVEGVSIASSEDADDDEDLDLEVGDNQLDVVEASDSLLNGLPFILKSDDANIDSEENISQTPKQTVKNNRYMKITSINDIQEDKLGTDSEIQASSIRTFISEQLNQAETDYSEKQASIAAEKEANEVQTAETSKALLELGILKDELSQLKAAQEADQKQNAFNERMTALNEEYELEGAESAIIAKQVKDLSDDEYTSWKKDFDVLAKAKVKSAESDEVEDEVEENAIEDEVEDLSDSIIEARSAKKGGLPNILNLEEGEKSNLQKSFSIKDGGVTFG